MNEPKWVGLEERLEIGNSVMKRTSERSHDTTVEFVEAPLNCFWLNFVSLMHEGNERAEMKTYQFVSSSAENL